ncbi:hypothetical protein CYMTET_47584 [Cymbomonas tetramitiformis]|uniref:Uncharacterized protein n=1 Tax=Cymbomonas tetramitiformis TaxID=36881 RepID=A0AAE0BVU5_9CHLO|nr:hypothetical protein CYMTET_47584 [Cymbomonas tetramitiformis]
MSTARQHARMAPVRSVAASLPLRRHHLTSGYGLVASGGAYAPDTNIESIAFANDDNSDHTELRPQRPPLSPPPCVPLGHCLVVRGGAAVPIPPILLSAFALVCSRVGEQGYN